MILVDLNQVLISNLMAQTRGKNDVKPNKEMVRHMVLNSIRGFNLKFKEEFGQQILCSDAEFPWRRKVFPHYKHTRRANREKSGQDWDNIFKLIMDIKEEIAENLPYMVLSVDNAEADDIIATLVKRIQNQVGPNHEKKVLILSGDKDFIQLHGPNVKQYNPVLNKFVGKGEDPTIYIKEHILKGDRSDGIPNVLSDDNVFIEGRRQRPLSKKKIESWVNEVFMTFTEEEQKNYNRNRQLIDLSCIPPELEEKIINEFIDVKVASRDKILNYFITKKLKTLIEVIDEF